VELVPFPVDFVANLFVLGKAEFEPVEGFRRGRGSIDCQACEANMADDRRRKWISTVVACVFLAAFVWLRWFSVLWQFRWTGICFGAAFVLTSLPTRQRMQARLDFAKRYAIPKRVALVGAVVCTWLGGSAMNGFLTGRSFFQLSSGARAASDDGLFAIVVLAAAFESGYLFWLQAKGSSGPRSTKLTTHA